MRKSNCFFWLVIGTGIGTALGVAFGNIPAGSLWGAGAGLLALLLSRLKKE